MLADARQEPGIGGRALARVTRSRSVEGTVALGPNRDALAQRSVPGRPLTEEVVVLASGNLGLIYLPLGMERLTLEQIAETHPRLLDTLTAHPGIGFVMVRSQAAGRSRDWRGRPPASSGRRDRGRGPPRPLRPNRG